MSALNNIFEKIPENLNNELIEEILKTKNFRLERIISAGHHSPPDFWYDQDENEFVFLVSGCARISFNDGRIFDLKAGDYFVIKAHQKHRIVSTDQNRKTFWLTLFY